MNEQDGMVQNAPTSDTVVVVPTYNERDNILELIEAVLRALPTDLLVVDDDSPDGTAQLVRTQARANPRVSLLVRKDKKKGLGPTYIDGFVQALQRGYKYVFQMDADFSHDPSALPILKSMAKDYDLVIGSRYVPGGDTPGWNWKRRMISRCGGWYARQLLNLPIRDLTSGFKCWRSETLRSISLETITTSGFAFQIETTFRTAGLGKRLVEVPIVFCDRTKGDSKMSLKILLEGLFKVWEIRFSKRKKWK